MPNTTTSQFMSLPIPIVGVDPGPQYGTDLNSCFTKIDQHNHSSGQGVTITPSGISITSDLPFNSNNARSLRTTTFAPVNSAITASGADLTCLYAVTNELYYNDGAGNQVKITSGGNVNAGAGSITGMTGSASVALSGGIFSFLNTSGNPAGISGSSFIAHANGNAITIEPNASLSGNYNIIFPSALPGSTGIMQLDSSGNVSGTLVPDASTIVIASSILKVPSQGITNTQIANSTVTVTQLAPLNYEIGASSGGFITTSGTPVNVANMVVSITTLGRPVVIAAIPDGANSTDASWQGNGGGYSLFLYRGNTQIAQFGTVIAPAIHPPSTLWFMDLGVIGNAGTYQYTVKMAVSAGTGSAYYMKLLLYEQG